MVEPLKEEHPRRAAERRHGRVVLWHVPRAWPPPSPPSPPSPPFLAVSLPAFLPPCLPDFSLPSRSSPTPTMSLYLTYADAGAPWGNGRRGGQREKARGTVRTGCDARGFPVLPCPVLSCPYLASASPTLRSSAQRDSVWVVSCRASCERRAATLLSSSSSSSSASSIYLLPGFLPASGQLSACLAVWPDFFDGAGTRRVSRLELVLSLSLSACLPQAAFHDGAPPRRSR